MKLRIWCILVLMFCSFLSLGACFSGNERGEVPEDLCGVPVESRHVDPLLPASGDIEVRDGKPNERFAAQCRVLTDNSLTMHISVLFDREEMDAVVTARRPPYEFSAVRETDPGVAIGREGAFASLYCYSGSNVKNTHLNGEITIYDDEVREKIEIQSIEKFAQEYFNALKVKVDCTR